MKKEDNILIYYNTKNKKYFCAIGYTDTMEDITYYDDIYDMPKKGFNSIEEAKKFIIENKKFIRDQYREANYKVLDNTTYTERSTREEELSFNINEI